MNRRRDGGSDHFLATLTMSFALKTSAKMVASALATQGCNSGHQLTTAEHQRHAWRQCITQCDRVRGGLAIPVGKESGEHLKVLLIACSSFNSITATDEGSYTLVAYDAC